jgi:hypothetical protein
MTGISDETVFQRKNDLLSSRMDQETVMMHPESGKYFSLNPVATRVWEMLEIPLSLAEIVEILLSEFEVSYEQCQKETKEFLQTLIEKDIIEIKV